MIEKLNKRTTLSITIIVGFAIFAMFFGAGNLIYPLSVGAHSGPNVLFGLLGFLIAGIIIPLLGLFAISLYHGNYKHFFAQIGRVPGFIVALLVIILLGIFVATPRCSFISFGTLTPIFPSLSHHTMLFNLVFFIMIYLISMKQNRIVDALGWVLSPMKLSVLFILIILGVGTTHHPFHPAQASSHISTFTHALKAGYGTMDLLAAFFFCAFVHRTIQYKLQKHNYNSDKLERRLTIYACLIGACLLAIVYGSFILISNFHAGNLQHIATQELIGSLSLLLLHEAGGIFVAVCVTLACFSTAIALTSVTVEFIQTQILRHRFSYHQILLPTIVIVFIISNLGFDLIMKIAIPILSTLYPPLLGLTIGNIIYKLKGWNIGLYLFYITLIVVIVLHLI